MNPRQRKRFTQWRTAAFLALVFGLACAWLLFRSHPVGAVLCGFNAGWLACGAWFLKTEGDRE